MNVKERCNDNMLKVHLCTHKLLKLLKLLKLTNERKYTSDCSSVARSSSLSNVLGFRSIPLSNLESVGVPKRKSTLGEGESDT